MFTYLIQASTSLIVLYGLYHFVFSELTFFKYNRAFLLVSIIGSLFLPFFAPMLIAPHDAIPEVIQWVYVVNEVSLESAENSYITGSPFTMTSLLWLIYSIGVIIVLAKMIYGLWNILTNHYSGSKEIKNGITIVTTERVHLPYSFFNTIYLSKHVPLQSHICTILEHEKIHIRHWHSIDVLMVGVVQAFFWFNPIIIFYKRALRQSHEYLADQTVCKSIPVNNYTDLLLAESQSGLELALTNQFFHSQIKKRIQMMTTNKTSKFQSWKYALVLPVIAILMFVFSCKETSTVDPVSSESTTQNNENAVESGDETYSEAEMKDIFKVVEEMPRFPGCEQIATMDEKEECAKKNMLEYIYKNLKYPKLARESGIEGQCVAQFIISKDGSIENIKILRDIGGDCGEAVRAVVSSMNDMPEKWISGKQSGKPVNVLYTLPVKFKLEDDGKSIGMSKETPKSKSTIKSKELESTPKLPSIKEANLQQQILGDDDGYYVDQKNKNDDILDAMFNKKILNKPMLLIDGVVTDVSFLNNKKFKSETIIVLQPQTAFEKYGKKAQYGSVEFIEPVFTSK